MKYLIVVFDGMADVPLPALGGKTPMMVAKTPTLDKLCPTAEVGMVLNVPQGMVPESDTANLSILSYSPLLYSKGRSPLEAVSMGLEMKDSDVAYRANLVTLSEGETYENRIMLDHSADEISTEEGRALIAYLNEHIGDKAKRFFGGISYRHCLLWDGGDETVPFARPHDIIGREIDAYLPKGEKGAPFLLMMKESAALLQNHPINLARVAEGKKPANSLWFWSPGKKPALPSFKEKWGIRAAVISAVDLIRGIGLCANMDVLYVEGATGTLDTNYQGKANAAISAFEDGADLVFIHVEGPDECSHRGEMQNKITAISNIDQYILAPVFDYLSQNGEDFRILALPDHPTSTLTRTHCPDAVPYLLWHSDKVCAGIASFCEETAKATDIYLPSGTVLMEKLLSTRGV
ncbi:MAG: cofactor-independent phosphoglycerate mutase [Clostridia bacterium]|nr:cofactor-independent phosphoglycerate mutase [Clostridia bacterium]